LNSEFRLIEARDNVFFEIILPASRGVAAHVRKIPMEIVLWALGGALILYLLFWPNGVKPVKWQPPRAPSLQDPPYQINDSLKGLQRIAHIGSVGPEGISVDGMGRLYAGYADGKLMRFAPDGSEGTLLAQTGGRPFGTAAMANGRVLTADALKGLLQIDPHGNVEVLATEAAGRAFGFLNDLDIDHTGANVYFSDSSSKWGTGHDIDDILEHGGHGRLLRYEFASRTTSVLLSGLQFANGVAVGPGADFVLVAESGEYRVQRFWLKGPKAGTSEVFIDNLPGFPDNLSFNGRDRFWLALAAPRHPLVDMLADKIWLRQLVSRIPAGMLPQSKRHGMVLALNLDGKVTVNAQHVGAAAYSRITSVCESGEWLYCGSADETAIGRIALEALPWRSEF
jgi:sugar lactone lactonase YvrE